MFDVKFLISGQGLVKIEMAVQCHLKHWTFKLFFHSSRCDMFDIFKTTL